MDKLQDIRYETDQIIKKFSQLSSAEIFKEFSENLHYQNVRSKTELINLYKGREHLMLQISKIDDDNEDDNDDDDDDDDDEEKLKKLRK